MHKPTRKLRLDRSTIRQLQRAALATPAGGRDDWEYTRSRVIEGCPETYAAPCQTVYISCRMCA